MFLNQVNLRHWKSSNNVIYFGKNYLVYFTDIDECSMDDQACDVNARCINTQGSFACLCKKGYRWNGQVCEGKIRQSGM